MGNPRAKATVVLRDPENGAVRVFEKGDQLTDWALDEITNPEVVDLPDADDDGGSDGSGDNGAADGADDSGAGSGDNGADSGAAPANPDDAPPPADEPKPKAPRTRARRTTKSTAK